MLVLLLGGCGDGLRTAAQLVLTTDPSLGSRADLQGRVGPLQVIVDGKQGGLQGVNGPGPRPSGGTAVDWDSDGQLEVVFEVARQPGDELPVLEIGLDDNVGRELDFRILGFSGQASARPGDAAAMGAASGVCETDEVRQIGVPFNLRSWVRPPRVILVLPASGAKVPQMTIGLSLIFSTTIKKETLPGNVKLRSTGNREIPVSFDVETLVYPEASGLHEERSLVQVGFGAQTVPGILTVSVGPGVHSAEGRSFDQDPGTAVADAFESRFDVDLAVGGGGHPCDACPDGYLCDDQSPGCIPALSCSSGCARGSVCDASRGWCVEDCRSFGMCAGAAQRCDPATGLCRPL